MKHRLVFHQWVPYPADKVFRFFANPENLPPLMPGWQKSRIETQQLFAPLHLGVPIDGLAGKDSRMTISFRAAPGLPMRMQWDATITDFAWGEHFCDFQDEGPFGYWKHCHQVHREPRNGVDGTNVTDDVTYSMKLGLLGDVANALGGAAGVRMIFAHRQQMLPVLLARAYGSAALH